MEVKVTIMSSINKRFFILGFLLIFSISTVSAGTLQNSFFNVNTLVNSAGASLATEKSGYVKGETVVINGEGFGSFEDVSLSVESYSEALQQNIVVMQWNVFTSKGGGFTASIPFDSLSSDSGRYTVKAFGSKTQTSAETSISNVVLAAGANIDQCANGGVGDPVQPCSGTAWVNGNVNQSKAHYTEGQSVPYRVVLSGFTPGSTGNSITIGYDTTKGGKHALDYLTTFTRTESLAMGNNPCSGVSGCNLGTFSTAAIPTDSKVTSGFDQIPGNSDDITQIPGLFTLFGGTITGVSGYTVTGSYAGDSHTSITITFTAGSADMVLAWAGHIGTRFDWGLANSAINISGSPYHMSQDHCSFGCGGMDRALSATAVNLDSKITIILIALPPSAQVFPFSATGTGVSAFSEVNDGIASVNSITFNNLLAPFTSNTYNIGENLGSIGSYQLTNIGCSIAGGGGSTASPNVPLGTVGMTLNYGDSITCIFTNAIPTAANVSAAGRVADASGNGLARTLVKIQNTSNGEIQTTYTNIFGNYRFDNLPAGDFYIITVSNKRYVFEPNTRTLVLNDAVDGMDFTASQ
jgi:hypothetical protein